MSRERKERARLERKRAERQRKQQELFCYKEVKVVDFLSSRSVLMLNTQYRKPSNGLNSRSWKRIKNYVCEGKKLKLGEMPKEFPSDISVISRRIIKGMRTRLCHCMVSDVSVQTNTWGRGDSSWKEKARTIAGHPRSSSRKRQTWP